MANKKTLLKQLKGRLDKISDKMFDVAEQQYENRWSEGRDNPDLEDPELRKRGRRLRTEYNNVQRRIKSLESSGKPRTPSGRGGGGGSLMKQIGGGAAVGRKAIKKLMDEL